MASYFICASARTGTNLLATALRNTGVAGVPFEYFSTEMYNQPFMLGRLGLTEPSAGPLDFAGRLDLIRKSATSRNGVFGATVHWGQFANLMAAIGRPPGTRDGTAWGPDAIAALHAAFPDLRLIWLRRENKVAQAISHQTASKTGRWYETNDSAPPPDVPIPFDFARISQLVDLADVEERSWRALLADAPAVTLALTYEELAADFHGVLRRVLALLGLSVADEKLPAPRYRRQADARSAQWERQYREQLASQAQG